MKNTPFVKVWCSCCNEEHGMEDITFLDIAENMRGHDEMTFRCNVSGNTHVSLVYANGR